MRLPVYSSCVAALCAASIGVHAQTYLVQMYLVGPQGKIEPIGLVSISDTPEGVRFAPVLRMLPPGLHGFHIHEKPSCNPDVDPELGKRTAARAAGGHLDPGHTGRHEGPAGLGHLGDLPALSVDINGRANVPVLARRLEMSDLPGHSLIIHAGGDNYSDLPEKLGGGGPRIACGIVEP